MEWLEVRIVVQNKCLTIESCIETLNGDWEPLVNDDDDDDDDDYYNIYEILEVIRS